MSDFLVGPLGKPSPVFAVCYPDRPPGESCRGRLEPVRTCGGRRELSTHGHPRDKPSPRFQPQGVPREPAGFRCFLFHFNLFGSTSPAQLVKVCEGPSRHY